MSVSKKSGWEPVRDGPDPRSDEELEALRDDDVVRRAELWATGATIHDVKSLIGSYRTACAVLDRKAGYRDVTEPGVRRWALECMACWRETLEAYMRHGDYRKARLDHPLPKSFRD